MRGKTKQNSFKWMILSKFYDLAPISQKKLWSNTSTQSITTEFMSLKYFTHNYSENIICSLTRCPCLVWIIFMWHFLTHLSTVYQAISYSGKTAWNEKLLVVVNNQKAIEEDWTTPSIRIHKRAIHRQRTSSCQVFDTSL